MLQALRKRIDRDEEGFTLIELMVVVLIIAILIAIAIPTFLGAQDRARDRGAQSDLRNALTAAKTLATDEEGQFQYDDTATGVNNNPIDEAVLELTEPSLNFGIAPDDPTAVNDIDVTIGDDAATLAPLVNDFIMLERASASGKWFGVRAHASGAVTYCKSDDGTPVGIAACDDAKW